MLTVGIRQNLWLAGDLRCTFIWDFAGWNRSSSGISDGSRAMRIHSIIPDFSRIRSKRTRCFFKRLLKSILTRCFGGMVQLGGLTLKIRPKKRFAKLQSYSFGWFEPMENYETLRERSWKTTYNLDRNSRVLLITYYTYDFWGPHDFWRQLYT